MPRPLTEILAHLRAVIADGSVRTTLVQTDDLAVLCDAADPGAPKPLPDFLAEAIRPRDGWRDQPAEYYAAHFLVGTGLLSGDVRGNFNALVRALRKEYEMGVQHGRTAPEWATAI